MARRFGLNFEALLDGDTAALSDGSLTFLASGTSNLVPVYADAGQTLLKTNPVALDPDGKHGDIFVPPVYRIVVKDKNGAVVARGDVDPVYSGSLDMSWAGTLTDAIALFPAPVNVADGQAIVVAGRATVNDGYQGTFIYKAGDAATVFAQSALGFVDAAGRRWFRVFSGAVNARWFGALGDGATDDTTALNAGLAYAYAVGATLFAPPGIYRVTGLTLAVTGFTTFGFAGAGPGNTVLKKLGGAATPVLAINGVPGAGTNCRQSVISGMTLDGNGVANCDGLVLRDLGSLQCRSVLTQNCRYGLFGQSMIKTQHYNCEYNSGMIGVVIRLAAGGEQPNFNFFYDCVAQSNQGPAWDIGDGSHNVLIGADIEHNGLDGASPQVAVRETITAGIGVGKFSMIDCHLERGQGGYDVHVKGGAGEIDVDLYGLEILGSHGHQSIMLEAGVRTATLINPFIPATGDAVVANCDNFICTGGEISVLTEGFTQCAIVGLHTSTVPSYTKFRPAPV